MRETEKIKRTVESATSRLDVFVAETMNISRARARALCEKGAVRINNKRSRSGAVVLEGDLVEISESGEVNLAPELVCEELQLGKGIKIHLEDELLLVIEKPRRTHSVRQRKEDSVTVADAIAHYLPEVASVGRSSLEAGLVQRLDYYTSGLMIVAKSGEIWEQLHQSLIQGEIKKEYLALVDGRPKWERRKVEQPLVASETAKKMEPSSEGKTVVTEAAVYQTRNKINDAAIIKATSRHTIRHQIRAHLAFLGHPLVGDSLYGSRRRLEEFLGESGEGFFLHATTLSFNHPKTGKTINLKSESEFVNSL